MFIIPESKKTVTIINDPDQLKQFYEQHKNDVFIGYNSRHYDQYILKGLLLDMNPYDISHHIIAEQRQGWQYSREFMNLQLYNFDIKTTLHSLKELEGFMGNDIQETSVSFDIDRQLTQEEIQEVVKYCKHDVEQTIEVFLHRKAEFDSQIQLIKAFNLPIKYISKTKAQLSSIILGASKKTHNDEFNLKLPDTLILKKPEYQDIFMWYLNTDNHDYEKRQEVFCSDVPHVFGWGGLHGAIEQYQAEGIIINMDVASYYPALIIEYDYLSRNVSDPKKYREIRDTRLKLKAEKNPMQNPYKIVLNSTFGASKDKYNNLYDPLQANNICVAGQLLLLDLIEKLEGHWELIQSNTDGLIGKVNTMEEYEVIKTIAAEWESRTRMVLEFDIFKKIYQKDVNNYIIISADGKYKSKGAYVKKLNPIDNDLPIVNKALVDYFTKCTPVEDTINSCDKLIMFQKITKLSYKYSHAMHGDKKLSEKCLRTFASKDDDPGVFKVKQDGKKEKIANTPEKCFIYNGDVNDLRVPRKLDKQWYINVAYERLSDFMGREL